MNFGGQHDLKDGEDNTDEKDGDVDGIEEEVMDVLHALLSSIG